MRHLDSKVFAPLTYKEKWLIALLVGVIVFLTAVDAHCQIQPELVSSSSYGAYMDQMLPLPDAPGSVSMLSQSQPLVSTTGLSRSEKWAIAANVGLRITDVAISCNHLANGLREQWLPTQSCAGVASFVLAGIPAQIIGMRLAKHYGHPWMSRAIEWGFPIGSAVAVGYSTLAHQRRKP